VLVHTHREVVRSRRGWEHGCGCRCDSRQGFCLLSVTRGESGGRKGVAEGDGASYATDHATRRDARPQTLPHGS